MKNESSSVFFKSTFFSEKIELLRREVWISSFSQAKDMKMDPHEYADYAVRAFDKHFSVWKQIEDPTQKIEKIAKIAHEINAAYCRSLGDNSQPSWDEAPQWQKDSAVKGVQFHLDNPGASPAASHESWLKQKQEDGWKYGPVKNPETKEHPCFVPYDELPAEQRAKDYLFKQTIESLREFVWSESVR